MKTAEGREVVYWGQRDANQLTYTDKDEAIEEILDGIDKFPSTIEICGYAEMRPNWEDYRPLKSILERLDEEYGDDDLDSEYTKPTQAMKEAEKTFMEVIAREYMIFMCEIVTHETINVLDWIKSNRPDWPACETLKGGK